MKLFQYISNRSNRFASLIIASAIVLAVASVWNDAPIVDEIPHIGAGYSYIAKGDARLNPEHPPLAKDLAGIGVALTNPTDLSFTTKFWQEDINGQWEFGRHLIFQSGSDTEKLIKFAKLPQLLFFFFSAIIIFRWSKELFGPGAALIALFLFSFSPTVMTHSRFVTTDVPALFGVLLSSFYFNKFLKNPGRNNIIKAGLALGVAQLTKYSLFLINPFFAACAVLIGLLSHRNKIKTSFSLLVKTAGIMIIAYALVWIYYIPHVVNYPSELQKAHTRNILQTFGKRHFADPVVWMADKPVIRAFGQYSLGLLMVVQRAAGGNTTYFLGEVDKEAWESYFPTVYFIKEPLPFWFLLVVVLGYFGSKFEIRNSKFVIQRLRDWMWKNFTQVMMFLWIALYWYTSITSNLNIGVRHLMPVYGFTFILLAGGIIRLTKSITDYALRIKNKKRLLTSYFILHTSLFGWYFAENIKTFPYYLTYFNQAAGGPENGFYYVTDSNLDWGQDLKRLADWANENNVDKVYLDYFGWSEQYYYLKDKFVWLMSDQYKSRKEFLDANPEGGFIAVSANFYMGFLAETGHTNYGWLRLQDRYTTIGNSIFVWEVRPK